jgi:hypothetical protein
VKIFGDFIDVEDLFFPLEQPSIRPKLLQFAYLSDIIYFSIILSYTDIYIYSKYSSSENLFNPDSIISVKINKNSYLPKSGNSLMRGLSNKLQQPLHVYTKLVC